MEPCEEAFVFNNINRKALFKGKSCKILISFGLIASHMRSIHSVIDITTGSRVLQKDFIKPDRLPSTRVWNYSQLQSLTKQKVKIVVTIVL